MIENRGGKIKYPWEKLKEEGDYFDWSEKKSDISKVGHSIRTGAKNHGLKVSVRAVNKTTVRVYFLGKLENDQ